MSTPSSVPRFSRSTGLSLRIRRDGEVSPASARLDKDRLWAVLGMVILLGGLAGRPGSAWVWGIGIVTALGFALYLIFFTSDREVSSSSWQDRRDDLVERWQEIAADLSLDALRRYKVLQQRVVRLGEVSPVRESSSLLQPGEYLLWQYLKLLLARDHLVENEADSQESHLVAQRDVLLKQLESPELPESIRSSKSETVQVLDQRILTLRSRSSRLEEIESDLLRVEQWIALMMDQAAQHNSSTDAGRRIHYGRESSSLNSLSSLPGSNLKALDELITAQAGVV